MEPLQGLETLGDHGVGPKGVNIFCLCRNGDRKRRSQNQKEERKNGQGIPPRYTGLKTVYFHSLLVQQSFSFGSPQQAIGGGFRVLTLYYRNAEGSICILPVSRTTTYARSIIVFPIWQMRWKSLRLNSLSKTHRRQGMPLGLDPGMPDNDVIPLGTTVPFCLLSGLWKRAYGDCLVCSSPRKGVGSKYCAKEGTQAAHWVRKNRVQHPGREP